MGRQSASQLDQPFIPDRHFLIRTRARQRDWEYHTILFKFLNSPNLNRE